MLKKTFYLSSILALLSISLNVSAASIKLKTDQEYLNDSKSICTKQWTKRGELNQRMFNYCMEKQSEDIETNKRLFQQYSGELFFSEVAFPFCSNKWTKRGVTDTNMLAYCLEEEIDGFKDYQYYRKNYSPLEVDAIAQNALERFHSWNMVAYKLKNAVNQ